MKIATNTVHTLSVDSQDETLWRYRITVDSDNTAKLAHGDKEGNETQWLGRDELIALRSLITKALSLMP